MELVAKHNKTFADHLKAVAEKEKGGKHTQAQYLFWHSQNEFLGECGKLVKFETVKKIHQAIYYTIITDGTPNRSHSEQICFLFCFLQLREERQWEQQYRFLKLEEIEKKARVDIANLTLTVLHENGLDIKIVEIKDMIMVQLRLEPIKAFKP
ncbi:uncharacterized protein LOC136096140 [Hydra vulgaris]|uniref:uncharacterized protein LOC136096140 n=1 Tax=Hydra vulgaris TaxID=6087 RepID=UPI0032EA4777